MTGKVKSGFEKVTSTIAGYWNKMKDKDPESMQVCVCVCGLVGVGGERGCGGGDPPLSAAITPLLSLLSFHFSPLLSLLSAHSSPLLSLPVPPTPSLMPLLSLTSSPSQHKIYKEGSEMMENMTSEERLMRNIPKNANKLIIHHPAAMDPSQVRVQPLMCVCMRVCVCVFVCVALMRSITLTQC
jgi:hypothetical protein